MIKQIVGNGLKVYRIDDTQFSLAQLGSFHFLFVVHLVMIFSMYMISTMVLRVLQEMHLAKSIYKNAEIKVKW